MRHVGVLAVGAFVAVVTTMSWLLMIYTIGLRVSEREERYGLDMGEVGLEAYPDFDPRPAH